MFRSFSPQVQANATLFYLFCLLHPPVISRKVHTITLALAKVTSCNVELDYSDFESQLIPMESESAFKTI